MNIQNIISRRTGGPRLDADRNLEGLGFKQRRADKIIPEDPLILEWLRQIQDTTTTNKDLLFSEEENQIHTFNNSLVAMAFIVKGEKERAERILDFYAEATDKDNDQPMLQNFYYKGEARGFFQSVSPKEIDGKEYYYNMSNSDRWMGDIAWLLLAYKYYQQTYDSGKYQEITRLLKDLLISWYKDADAGGYVQHGWRSGDKRLHENHGHPEGNIDCYAVLKICGEDGYAKKIKAWLDKSISGDKLPLDLYTWRVLAYGPEAVNLLDIPEFDLRYRKTLRVNNQLVAGFYHGPEEIENIWLDGTGHIACAYITLGDKQRGYFYSNQLDAYITERDVKGVKVHVLPYTANKSGGYNWVDTNKGCVSVGAWYIFSKNGFNPLKLEKVPVNY